MMFVKLYSSHPEALIPSYGQYEDLLLVGEMVQYVMAISSRLVVVGWKWNVNHPFYHKSLNPAEAGNKLTALPKISFLVTPLKFFKQHFLLCDSGLNASKSLQVLQLSFNKISTLQPEDLNNLQNLTELHLQHNLISSLHPQMFQKLTQLRVTTLYLGI